MLLPTVIDAVDIAGLDVTSNGTILGNVTSITTQGDGATGALLRAVDGVIFAADGLISTVGDAAPGLDVKGSVISLDLGDVTTQGIGSNGVQLVSTNGPITLDADLIDTSGDLSTAALLTAAGDVDLNVGVLRTQGAQALGLDISTDPAACVLLGTGGCDVTAAADEITTNGFGGIGALVSAATGVTTLNVDVLQTGGDEAAGLNLQTDPTACATLGVGACDQNFTVNDLRTSGLDSIGAIVRAAGNVSGDIGVLRTSGDDAVGIDLASDPDACLTLGAGACGNALSIGELTTQGNGATGVLARVVGPTTLNLGLLVTLGDNANGIDIAANPTVCALIGAGACDTTVTATRISTQGQGAAGAVLRGLDTVVFAVDDLISTVGDNAPGLDIEGSTITVDLGDLTTQGVGSNGVQLVSTDGPITLNADLIDTSGDLSTAALLRAAGDVNLNVGVLRTQGAQALGLDISTDPAACVLLGTGGCDVTAAADEITTNGFGGIGALVSAATGVTTIDVDLLQTGGDEAAGLDLSTDPTACATLGTGACDQNFTVGNLLTGGARSPAALIRAAGNVTGSISVLRTQGDDAIGLDLASDPDACVLLGAGGCGNAFSIGELTTQGDGAIGVLARVVGPTTLNLGLLETLGENATGIDLAADPAACALIGAGACDVTLGADRITTQGNGALGALISAPGNIVANIGALSTAGDNATGLGIVLDPTVCLVLGPGACSVDANVGDVGTGGDNSPGVDVDAGESDTPVDVETGDIDTGGNASPGVDIDTGGAVDVDTGDIHTGGDASPGVDVDGGDAPIAIDTGDVDTDGNGSAGVIVNGGDGPITVDTGDIDTGGANSPGIDVTGEGPIDIGTGDIHTGGNGSTGVIVDGGAGAIDVDTGDIDTDGDGSAGVDVTGDGPIAVDTGDIQTDGEGATGVIVAGGDGSITIGTGDIETGGNDASGVDIVGTGPITVGTGAIETVGNGSTGVAVGGGAGPVDVSTGPITTTGDNATGIDLDTTDGDQTIVAGPITVTGPGSSGITADAAGCATVAITATGPISAAQGRGIHASSGCAVTVTTMQGASVDGDVAGIDVASGTGATITIGGSVSSGSGPAINADGAAALVTITDTGTVTGRVDLTDGNDQLVNFGRFRAFGDIDFGAGDDAFENNATFAVRPDSTTAGTVRLNGLERFANRGLVEMRNGVAGDVLALPGSFAGSGASTLGLDVTIREAGSTADRLEIGGAATGSTTIMTDLLNGNDGILVNDLVLVSAGAGSSPGAFTLVQDDLSVGLVRYDLVFDPTDATYALFGTPNDQALELLEAVEGARQTSYRSNDAWSGHMQQLRDGRGGADADTPERGSALWGQMFGSVDKRRERQDFTAFGQTRTVVLDHRQDFFGGQAGYDFASGLGDNGFLFGVTAGYANSAVTFRANADRFTYDSANVGVYGSVNAGPFFLNALAKYERHWMRAVLPGAGVRQKIKGDGYGSKAEAGLRFGGSSVFVEPAVSIEYVRTSLDDLVSGPSTIDSDSSDGLRGKAGLRIGTDQSWGDTKASFYLRGNVVHEFKGRNAMTFADGGNSLDFDLNRIGTYGQAAVGFTVASAGRVSGFVEATGDWSDDYKGGGARGGISIRF
ncbi:autotransporter outer membrane beta-barrel domain-containing protein [Sphingomonas sp. PL-96]|uniref:autotransporter outer membrane beta-barrel domain-containing protein n=1 Tax=Sphingomonas sp. PL-96 TaxID=2887201 RepID=UPI001E554C3B|nr:autotransporter outer membrane beta-barrel domain-containing protein [Sphingomonas sp. PL-96]MCC2976631.1 autotransporter outer membrane beta-barrel domain-containing protein [Sphingomonas sp. PL-96]